MLYDMCISVAVLIACAIIVCLAAYMSRKFSSDVYEDDLYECIYDEDGNAHTVNVGSRPATTSHDPANRHPIILPPLSRAERCDILHLLITLSY